MILLYNYTHFFKKVIINTTIIKIKRLNNATYSLKKAYRLEI